MGQPADLNPLIVEALYREALLLAEEARIAFDVAARLGVVGERDDLKSIALSCEALRTTTRTLHAIGWLLNQRAYLAGELSEFQLRRHGALPPAQPDGDEEQLALLPSALHEWSARTRRFYARLERLDRAWRQHFAVQPGAVHRLRERLGRAVATF
jgi:regulator of CtrA degradation